MWAYLWGAYTWRNMVPMLIPSLVFFKHKVFVFCELSVGGLTVKPVVKTFLHFPGVSNTGGDLRYHEKEAMQYHF